LLYPDVDELVQATATLVASGLRSCVPCRADEEHTNVETQD